jgi:hypothetical protein
VYAKKFVVSTRKHEEKLSVVSLMQGAYFIKISGSDGGKIKTVRIQKL